MGSITCRLFSTKGYPHGVTAAIYMFNLPNKGNAQEIMALLNQYSTSPFLSANQWAVKNIELLPGQGPRWKSSLNQDQHQPLPKALPPPSQPHKQKVATKPILVINLINKMEIKKPDTQMTGMLPCLVLPATIIAISDKTEDSNHILLSRL